MADLTIQSPVSAFQSIRFQMSNDIWDWGIGNFFVERIPYSAKNGPLFASRLVKLFYNLTQEAGSKDREIYHVYEFGAGMGMLSFCFLNALKQDYPELYRKTRLHVTDGSSSFVSQLKDIQLFRKHLDRVELRVIQAENPLFLPGAKPFFAFSSYMLDSMPACHMEYSGGSLGELQVSTSIRDDQVLLDTTQYPPVLERGKSVLEILSRSSEKRKILAPKLVPLLDEVFHLVPIDEATSFSDEEKTYLKAFCETLPVNKKLRFNFVRGANEHIANVMRQMDPEGAYLISDFGFAGEPVPMDPDHLKSTYDVAAFSAVSFMQIRHFSDQIGVSHLITDQEADSTQDLLLTKAPPTDGVKSFFDRYFDDGGIEKIAGVLDRMLAIKDGHSFLTAFRQASQTLTGLEHQDYHYLRTISLELFGREFEEECHGEVRKLVDIYDSLAIDGFKIEGLLSQKKGDHESAIRQFKKVLRICENDSSAYAGQGVSLLFSRRFDEAIAVLKKSIYFSRNNEIWFHVLNIALMYKEQGLSDKAQETLDWPLKISDLHPFIMPPQVRAQFEEKKIEFDET